MRYLITLGVVVLALILWQPGNSSVAAADNPPGSYQQTCKNIRMRGDTLRARCKNTYNQWVNTSLDYVSRCTGDIANVDGQLQCSRDRDGDRDRDRDRDRGGYGGAPRGSYTETCRDIQARGNSLRATCQTVDNRWVDTYLDDFGHCVGEIVNDDGQLQCTRRGGWSVPRGSYTETCRQIYLRGDVMRARCQNRDGRWVWSQLNDWDSCVGGIVNDDGQLRCNRDRDRY